MVGNSQTKLVAFLAFLGATLLRDACNVAIAQYCGARCVVHVCELLDAPTPEFVPTVELLNGSSFQRLPSLAELANCLASMGLYCRLVDLELLQRLEPGEEYVAILHVNGSHFVVNERVANGRYRIWWSQNIQSESEWARVEAAASSVCLIVSSQASILDHDIAFARVWQRRYRDTVVAFLVAALVLAFPLGGLFHGKFSFFFEKVCT